MIVTCPRCNTRFSLPTAAIGAQGRTVKCARCTHKWFVTPDDEIPMDVAPMPKAAAAPRVAAAMPESIELDEPPPPEAEPEDDPFAKISELMRSSAPEPIPDVFATPTPRPPPRRMGAAGLILLLLLFLIAGSGAVLYFFQEAIIDKWPKLARTYERVGMRDEVVGADLAFRNYSSERLPQDNSEVLIVRGVIANNSEQPKEIPLLRLALYYDRTLLQDKIINPPQTTLDGHGTVGFRITLDQPDANASRFEVTFVAPKKK